MHPQAAGECGAARQLSAAGALRTGAGQGLRPLARGLSRPRLLSAPRPSPQFELPPTPQRPGTGRGGQAPRFRTGPRPLAAAAAPGPQAALDSQRRGGGGGGGGAGISLGAALTAPLRRSPSGGARCAAQSAFVCAVSHRITRIMRPPGPGRRAGRHRVATGGSRGRAAPPAPAPAREIPIEAAPPAPAPRRPARGRVNGAAAAAGAGPGRAVGGGARALFKPPKPLRAARPRPRPGRAISGSPLPRRRGRSPSGCRPRRPRPHKCRAGPPAVAAPPQAAPPGPREAGPRPPRKTRAPRQTDSLAPWVSPHTAGVGGWPGASASVEPRAGLERGFTVRALGAWVRTLLPVGGTPWISSNSWSLSHYPFIPITKLPPCNLKMKAYL